MKKKEEKTRIHSKTQKRSPAAPRVRTPTPRAAPRTDHALRGWGRAVKGQGAASGSPPLTHGTANKGAKGYFRATKYANAGAARGPMGGDQQRLRRRQLSTIGSLPPPIGERLRRGRGLPRRWVRIWGLRGGGSAPELRPRPLFRAIPARPAPPLPSRHSLRCLSVGTEHPRARASHAGPTRGYGRMARVPGRAVADEDLPQSAFRGDRPLCAEPEKGNKPPHLPSSRTPCLMQIGVTDSGARAVRSPISPLVRRVQGSGSREE